MFMLKGGRKIAMKRDEKYLVSNFGRVLRNGGFYFINFVRQRKQKRLTGQHIENPLRRIKILLILYIT